MRVAFFDAHNFEREAFEVEVLNSAHEFIYLDMRLNETTALLARGCEAVCSFANDKLDAYTLSVLQELGIKIVALRSAGFNHVDLIAAKRLGLPVVRVPEYSPYAVAEHAVALALTLNRKIHRAHARVRELNFSLEGLVGFDMHGKTVGLVGVGRIGSVLAKILSGFGCHVLLYDKNENLKLTQSLGGAAKYVPLDVLFRQSDLISLHVPLTSETTHLIDAAAIALMKPNVLIINTGRGALIDTGALVSALKQKKIGGAGLDVYEEEAEVFFADHSDSGIDDDLLARLLTFPNVIVTSHQGFLTHEALQKIAQTTVQSLNEFAEGKALTQRIDSPF